MDLTSILSIKMQFYEKKSMFDHLYWLFLSIKVKFFDKIKIYFFGYHQHEYTSKFQNFQIWGFGHFFGFEPPLLTAPQGPLIALRAVEAAI